MAANVAQKGNKVQLIAKAGDVEEPFVAAAQQLVQQDRADGHGWLADLREQAIQRLKLSGLPHRGLEAWRYTDLRSQLKLDFKRIPSASVDRSATAVFRDGSLVSSFADVPSGVELVSLREAGEDAPGWVKEHMTQTLDRDERSLVALNTALMQDGLLIRVAEGVTVEQPFHIRHEFTTGGTQSHIRILVVLEANAQATIVENFSDRAAEASFSDAVTTFNVGAGATLRHYKHQDDGDAAIHAQTVRAVLHEKANLDSFYLTTGAGFARTDGIYDLAGEGADVRVSGAYMLSGAQHADISTEIIHGQPGCTSREVFHGALLDRSHGIFQGRILVAQDAQKTDGHQMNRTLLLSERAKADAKPELEIYADDVKCSHGATVGELDEDALFYLRSRGLPLSAAKALLVEAFINQALEEIQDEIVRGAFAEAASAWITQSAVHALGDGQ